MARNAGFIIKPVILIKYVPELRELEPRAPGPSGTSDTEFDLEVLTAEGVEAPDIGGSPEIKDNSVFSLDIKGLNLAKELRNE